MSNGVSFPCHFASSPLGSNPHNTADEYTFRPVCTPPGTVNLNVGAEHVQKSRSPPPAIKNELSERGVAGCASFDGDGDRLVFHFVERSRSEEGQQWKLLDGDSIMALVVSFILRELGILGNHNLTFGVVQTAYANGASTAYINNVLSKSNCANRVKFTPTGVAHLHHQACKYDIGAYWEANGHGTVLFSEAYGAYLRRRENDLNINRNRSGSGSGSGSGTKTKTKINPRTVLAWRRLALLPIILSQCVGDALGDMLLPLAILSSSLPGTGTGAEEEEEGGPDAGVTSSEEWGDLWTDKQTRMTKVVINDRSIVRTSWDETRCLEPKGVQARIDELMARNVGYRSFVRPSGTEDVVRVFVEGEERGKVEEIGKEVERIVSEECGDRGGGEKEMELRRRNEFFERRSRL